MDAAFLKARIHPGSCLCQGKNPAGTRDTFRIPKVFLLCNLSYSARKQSFHLFIIDKNGRITAETLSCYTGTDKKVLNRFLRELRERNTVQNSLIKVSGGNQL